MKKRIISLLLISLMLLGMLPVANAAPLDIGVYTDGGWQFYVDENGNVELMDYNWGMYHSLEEWREMEVPAVLGGHPVTSIGYKALEGVPGAKWTVPASVRVIGESGLKSAYIKELTLSEGLEEIMSEGLRNLGAEQLCLPSTLKIIGPGAFKNSQILRLVIPAGVEAIGADIFNSYDDLEHVWYLGTAEQKEALNILGENTLLKKKLHCAVPASREATCGADGFTGYACTECDAIYAVTREEAPHHIYDQSGVCTVCGNVMAENWSYSVGETGVTLTAYLGEDTVIELPDSFEGKPVVALGKDLFKNKTDLEGVILPESLVSIGENAFYNCSNLGKIRFPAGVREFGRNAFHNCSSLQSLDLPEGITTVGQGAFNLCTGVTELKLPSTLKVVEDYGFNGCKPDTLTLPEGLTSIGQWAFAQNNNLTELVIPDSVEDLGAAFSSCRKLAKVKLPKNLEVLRSGTFSACVLRDLELPESLTTIEVNSLGLAKGESLVLPKNVSDINGRFVNADALDQLTIDPANPYLKIEGSNLMSKDGTVLYLVLEGWDDFGNNLRSYRVPDGVKRLSERALDQMDYITELVLPASLERVDAYALPHALYEGGAWFLGTPEQWAALDADYNGNDLIDWVESGTTHLHYGTPSAVGATCTDGGGVRLDCADCQEYTVLTETPALGHLFGADELCTRCSAENTEWTYWVEEGEATVTGYTGSDEELVVPYRLGDAVVTAIENNVFSDNGTLHKVTLPGGLRRIGDNAFRYCWNLSECPLPAGLESIGAEAFSNCPLTEVELPSGLTYIGDMAFGNTDIKTVTVPGSVELGRQVFISCDQLERATLLDGITILPNFTFDYCSSLVEVYLPSGLTEIGTAAFSGCTSLRRLTLPAGLESIDGDAFSGCQSLEKLDLPQSLTYLGMSAFQRCYALKSLVLPNTLEELPDGLVSDCIGLESITLPEGITGLPYAMFRNCISLKSVKIPEGVTVISSYLFEGCAALETVILPEGVTTIERQAFAGTGLKTLKLPKKLETIDRSAFCCSNWGYRDIPLTKIPTLTVDPANPYLKLWNNSVYSADGKTLLCYLGTGGEITFAPGLTEIGEYALYALEDSALTLPEGVETIGRSAFYGAQLETVKLPSTLKTVLSNAFAYTHRLRLIELPAGMEMVENRAFDGSLADVVVPADLQMIGSSAFNDMVGRIFYLGTPAQRDLIEVEYADWSEVRSGIWHYVTPGEGLAPTCTESGYAEFLCTEHGETLRTVAAPTGHDFDGDFCRGCGACRLQSVHPYAPNTDRTQVLEVPGANWIELTFGEETAVEAGYDFIELYDGTGTLLGRYTGAELAGKTVELETDHISLRLIADGTNEGYGYLVTALDAGIRLKNENGTVLNGEVGSLPENTELISEKFTPETPIALPPYSKAAHFEIRLEDENGEVQPDGSVEICLPLPEDLNPANSKVYRVEENGDWTDMQAVFEDGMLKFNTDHFSHYMVLDSIDTSLVVQIMQVCAGYGLEVTPQMDQNGDGQIRIADAVLLLRTLVGS